MRSIWLIAACVRPHALIGNGCSAVIQLMRALRSVFTRVRQQRPADPVFSNRGGNPFRNRTSKVRYRASHTKGRLFVHLLFAKKRADSESLRRLLEALHEFLKSGREKIASLFPVMRHSRRHDVMPQ